jgi:hypothetical protein
MGTHRKMREIKTYLITPIRFFLKRILLLDNKEIRATTNLFSSKYVYEYREL